MLYLDYNTEKAHRHGSRLVSFSGKSINTGNKSDTILSLFCEGRANFVINKSLRWVRDGQNRKAWSELVTLDDDDADFYYLLEIKALFK